MNFFEHLENSKLKSLKAFAEDVLEERRAKAAMAEEATGRIQASDSICRKYLEFCRDDEYKIIK